MALHKIQEVVQGVAEAIASALMMEVEIFDHNLVVVGATGRIRSKIGFKQDTAHVTAHILKVGISYVIEQPGDHALCRNCKIKNRCFCNAAMITPINISGHILGTISLLSFDEEQRRQLLTRQGQYLDFIARMGELLAGQVQLHDALTQVANNERQLKTIIDSVSEGIIAVNAAGQISYLNRYAEQLLNVGGDFLIGKSITRYFPDSPLPEVITKQSAVIEKEVCFHKNNIRLNFISSAYPVIAGEKVIGAVKTFKDIKQASRLAGQLISRHETTILMILRKQPALGNLTNGPRW